MAERLQRTEERLKNELKIMEESVKKRIQAMAEIHERPEESLKN